MQQVSFSLFVDKLQCPCLGNLHCDWGSDWIKSKRMSLSLLLCLSLLTTLH